MQKRIELLEELIKNLTNQILMGEPQTHSQEKQYKAYRLLVGPPE